MGVMSSFNRIGVVWSGAHHGLMTGILRDEWGMKGAAITDCSVMANYMDYRMGVLAGQDLWDGYSMGMATLDGLENDPAIVTAVQNAVKHIAYSITHSHAMNIGNATVIPVVADGPLRSHRRDGGAYRPVRLPVGAQHSESKAAARRLRKDGPRA